MSEELLLEIGTEEIPAAFMPGAMASLKDLLEKELSAGRVGVEEVRTFGTPRRLILAAFGVAAVQEDLVTRKIGPAMSIAYDADGNPTKAAVGFARGQGLDVGDLGIAETDKGEYICAEKKETGRSTADMLPELLLKVITSLPFPKSMRWHDLDFRFARPVHWILAVFGGRPVPLKLGNISSGTTTCGHRFMSPAGIRVSDFDSYSRALKDAGVVFDPAERRRAIEKAVYDLAGQVQGVPDADEALLEEVTHILEAPYPVLCGFEPEFLKLPREVLLTTMKKHQKYFPILSSDGTPLPHFIAVNNTRAIDPGIVISGHERVLRARLADAGFFYSEDCKKSLEGMTEALKSVVFQARLGTSYEKVRRFQQLALFIAERAADAALKPEVERAAYLCKGDLVSEMVGEFPELQGIMGREYARISGETQEVAEAVFEHYLPRFAGDRLPATHTGAMVGIADKLDTIAGCFAVGLIPTGTADPYALRRQCLGIINIVLDKKYDLSLVELVEKAVSILGDKATRPAGDICSDVLGFFSGRLTNLLTSQGLPYDVVDAVLALGVNRIADNVNRIHALHRMKQDPDFESLAVSFKRVVNILAGQASSGGADPSAFEGDAERALYGKYLELRDRVKALMDARQYVDALKVISTIRQDVDGFFDNVMVLAEDEAVRKNRLALLFEINSLFMNFADFSKIAVE